MKTISAEILLNQFPAYQGKFITIKDNQTVPDIITEILNAHEEFTRYYDKIAFFFDDSTTRRICNNIIDFLKKNIKYKKEKNSEQSTKVPHGILTLGIGDCKHFASFSGGVLDALNRMGYKINWYYRFASYKYLERTPYHVFTVVCDDNGDEIWIDPTPDADVMVPVWVIDKSNCPELINKK